jgi:serine/threonine protein phosphatase 1
LEYSAVAKYESNLRGRDFVVGDIHGAFGLARAALKRVGFVAGEDRLFCVGDLIDRGAASSEVLEFLEMPGVYSVMGNHDYDLSTMSIELARQLAAHNWNGLGWIASVDDEKLAKIQARLARLPLAIQVGDVGIVHAEVPAGMDWEGFLEAMEGGEDPVALESALWGRERVEARDERGVRGVGRVFSGHTVQWGGGRRLGNMLAIDTGAVFAELGEPMGFLTMVRLDCPEDEFDVEAGSAIESGVFTGRRRPGGEA